MIGRSRGWAKAIRHAMALGLTIVSVVASGVQAAVRLPREQTLYKAGLQWGPPTSFNPLGAVVAWPINNEVLLYETLVTYNLITGKLDPLLAGSYSWSGNTLTITLRQGTRWQDGEDLTTDDVIYTLELGKKHTLNYSPFWDYVSNVRKVSERQLQIQLNPRKPHREMVDTYLTQVRILPQHIWSRVEANQKDIRQYTNLQPVGSGPYKLLEYSPEQIVLERDDNYWGIRYFGRPAPKYIVHPIFKSNDAGNLALQRGEVDLSQQFAPEIWKMWQDRKLPVGTWFNQPPYHIPASIPSLWINVHKKPLDNPKVRRALAYAIDYAKIAETAMSRYSPTVSSSLIIPVGVPERKYFSKELVERYGWEYNPQKAIEILEKELGAKKGRDGIYVLPDGTRLGPFIAECPYGWTDWMTALEVVAQSARAVGIDVRTQYPEAPVWTDHRNTGNFDLLLNTPAGGYTPAHPWVRFRDVMDIRDVPPIGQVAFWNFGRYSNPRVAQLLDRAIATDNDNELREIYQELDRIFMTDVPVIPLMYRPGEFYEFNASVWTNFPTADNPVAPPQHNQSGIHIYYKIKPAKD